MKQNNRIVFEEDPSVISIVGVKIPPPVIWTGMHKHKFPKQNGNSHQRRKVRRANWRSYDKRPPLLFLDPTDMDS